MNLGNLTGLLGQLSPLLKVLGIDPAKVANRYTRDQIEPLFRQVAPAVVAQLEKDGLTPALKGDSPKAERQVIRSAIYLLFKECFKKAVPGGRGSNILADAARDLYDDKCVELVSPLITAETPVQELVQIVTEQLVEIIF